MLQTNRTPYAMRVPGRTKTLQITLIKRILILPSHLFPPSVESYLLYRILFLKQKRKVT
jgi:hypothetical protein